MKVGSTYTILLKEIPFILFGKKVCPDCGGKLKMVNETAGANLQGGYINVGRNRTYYDRIMEYKKEYQCKECRRRFTIENLTKKQ